MRKTALALTMLLLASTAYGADLSTAGLIAKAPPIQQINWTGFYLGLNVGGGWGTSQTSTTVDNLAVSNISANGLIGGGQMGFNYQLGNVVVGLETDGEWSNIGGSGPCVVVLGCSQSNKLKWEADVAGRLGYSFDRFLPYIKGGVAWGNLSHNFTVPVGNNNGGNDFITGAQSGTRSGWLLGLGLEYAISQNLSARLEYDFLDFGTKNYDVVFTGPSLGNRSPVVSGSFKDEFNTVKAGVSYKF